MALSGRAGGVAKRLLRGFDASETGRYGIGGESFQKRDQLILWHFHGFVKQSKNFCCQ